MQATAAGAQEAPGDDLRLADLDPMVMDTLDTEVRVDVEAARRLYVAKGR